MFSVFLSSLQSHACYSVGLLHDPSVQAMETSCCVTVEIGRSSRIASPASTSILHSELDAQGFSTRRDSEMLRIEGMQSPMCSRGCKQADGKVQQTAQRCQVGHKALSTSCLAFNGIIKTAGPERISGVVVRALFWPHFLLGSSQCRSNLRYLLLVARAGGFLHTLSRMQLKEAEESICSNLSHN